MAHVVTVTEKAAVQIQKLISNRGRGCGIRVGVNTRGCSGMSYVLEYVDEPTDIDERVELDGVTVFVDPKAMLYILGTEIDWGREGLNEGFKFNNPNVKGECGCGESFKI